MTCTLKIMTAALLLSFAPGAVEHSDFSGIVVAITDGDTIKVMHDGHPETIRLDSIDCPEKKQAFGTKAKQYTASLCFQKQVLVHPRSRDRYKRIIADVELPDGRNLNAALVQAGYAWWYRKYAPQAVNLQQLESQARTRKLGLWQDQAPIPPWEYRHSPKPISKRKPSD